MDGYQHLNQLADIVLPTSPPWYDAWWWLAVTIFMGASALVIGVATLYRRHRQQHTPMKEACLRLDGVLGSWQQGKIDQREAAYLLAALLRLGLGLPQLHPEQAPPGIQDEAWRTVLRKLEKLRYSSSAATATLTPALFQELRVWLRSVERSNV